MGCEMVEKDNKKVYNRFNTRLQNIFYNAVSIEDATNQFLKYYTVYENEGKIKIKEGVE